MTVHVSTALYPAEQQKSSNSRSTARRVIRSTWYLVKRYWASELVGSRFGGSWSDDGCAVIGLVRFEPRDDGGGSGLRRVPLGEDDGIDIIPRSL